MIRFTNTLTRQLEPFEPQGDVVTMYVCGITPYDESHIGHAMSYIVFDVVKRYLTWRGYSVKHVQNFTDIDDRIIERANRLRITTDALVEKYIGLYTDDMRDLNVQPADVYPYATHEVEGMIAIIEGLVAKGFAYVTSSLHSEWSDVYYRVSAKKDYGKLSHRTQESLLAGARVEPGEQKEHAADFALWKGAKAGEPSWDSPWGKGRPGWHIECSAMSLRYLGATIDIHGGGEDLVFPHHENEIAQTEAFTGAVPFVRYWLHNAWVKMGEEKMSKSLGNFITIRDGLNKVGGDGLRLWVLTSHYRKPLTFSEDTLQAAKNGADRLATAARAAATGDGDHGIELGAFRERFIAAMDDDLNTPQALAVLFDFAKAINRAADDGRAVAPAQAELRELASVLGLRLEQQDRTVEVAPFVALLEQLRGELAAAQLDAMGASIDALLHDGAAAAPVPPASIDAVVQLRAQLRAQKQWKLADRVRDGLGGLGVVLEDGASGTAWKVG
ncbi:MAG TPA: cysteine--tRNA ligase [Dehalococcoidia bacterium]|nr:cysteine--tRNA ligase [Dehalococcoidia bacterium]